jgi:hypothetical protein
MVEIRPRVHEVVDLVLEIVVDTEALEVINSGHHAPDVFGVLMEQRQHTL